MRTKNYGRIVTPYSGIKETGVNVASLMIFLPFSEGNGNKTTCPKTGASWDIKNNSVANTGSLSWEANGAALSNLDSDTAPSAISSGADLSFESGKSYLFICSARVTGTEVCRCSLGDINNLVSGSNGTGFGMSDGSPSTGTGAFHSVVGKTDSNARRIEVDAGTDLSGTQSGVDVVMVAKYIPSSESLTYAAINFDSAASILAADAYTTTEDPVPYTLDSIFRFSGLALYGAALFNFSEFPSWIDTAIYWMANQWRHAGLGNSRYIYPLLRGVA